MRIESVDLFYLAMPEITTDADGSQDALLVRVRGGGHEGWGECEASPLTSIASFVCPMSHGVCRPVGAAVLDRRLAEPADIRAVAAEVAYNSMDLLQAPHMLSGVETALWHLLGYRRPTPKLAYASMLFGGTPAATAARCRAVAEQGFRAAKLGWGPFGRGTLAEDEAQLEAARDALGSEALLLVDAGQIWREDVEAAAARLPLLERVGAIWLEEPFHAAAYAAYGALARRSPAVRLAGGEAAHNPGMARHLIDYGKVGFIQIDCGRIGGIGAAKQVADYAAGRGVTYVNHTFTSHLALSASLQPFAGLADHRLCEYPAAPRELARAITRDRLLPDAAGEIRLPETPGLGVTVDAPGLARYLVEVEISVAGKTLHRTPVL